MRNLTIVFALVLCSSCSKDEIKDYSAENDQEIQAFIADNNLTAQKSSSGLYYVIDTPGTGDNPITTDRVKVSYKGYYTDGTVFDESTAEGVSFNLQEVIRGWTEGITYFKEGGSGKLLIPAHLAYGSNDFRGIPGGSVLIFDIELIYVNYVTENEEDIQKYIADNNLVAQQTPSGLYYTIDTVGDGAQPTLTDNVTLTYKGYFTDDKVFDESSQNVSFDLEGLIKGFSEGMTYFKEGGSGTLFIPSHLAYGNNGASGIPGGSILIFDVALISVN
ncbi:FKBP-type peptidyl-prolyl cis-trans isomerase [Algibacter sp. 2305UL17-15]|uniref:FKBP-type peptidyl-prolyl cis-trans isomerase n=1 Tax=Algibacter sp. 2305UL17-15 TaxID=3231268 RepID=UPI003458C22F